MYVSGASSPASATPGPKGTAGSPGSDSAESATSLAQVVPVARRHSKGAAACQVPGCSATLAHPHNKAHRICTAHRAASTIAAPGGPHRFCQQCNVLHPLYEFSGARRSCQRSLQRRRERRQRYRQQQRQHQQQRLQQGEGAGSENVSGSSGDDPEEPAADERSDWGTEPGQQQVCSETAHGSITWQPPAGPGPQVIVLTLPAAAAAAAAAALGHHGTAPWPAEASWQLDVWQHLVQPPELQPGTHKAAPAHTMPAHTPLPPPAQLPAGPLPVWDPAAEQQAASVSAQPPLGSFAFMQRQPPPQWQQPSPHLLPPTPLPPAHEQLPQWGQEPAAGQEQFWQVAQSQQSQQAQQAQHVAGACMATDGQWESQYSMPAPQPWQPTHALGMLRQSTHPLAGSAQMQRLDMGAQHAQHAQQVQQAGPDALVWQHSAPLSLLEPHPSLQQCGPAQPLPPGSGYAAPSHQRLPHCHSCPSLLSSLELATQAEAVPSERELLQLSCELGLL